MTDQPGPRDYRYFREGVGAADTQTQVFARIWRRGFSVWRPQCSRLAIETPR